MEKLREVSRRYLFGATASMLVAVATLMTATGEETSEETLASAPRWVASWSASAMAHGSAIGASRSFENQTVRQIAPISVGGTRLRVRLSNEYGVGPLIIGAAHIALQASGASIVPDSDRTLTFGGRPSTVVPEGTVALSDPVNLSVPANANLAISLYVPQNTGFATYHQNATHTTYVSGPGDFAAASNFPVLETATSTYWLSFVEVLPGHRVGALAIFGDSISEGATTTLDANRTAIDVLSRQFNRPRAPARLALLNQATGCGRLLRNFCGPSGLSRFERDVLNATGITHVVLELGLVDIIFPTAAGIPEEIVSADEVIAGLRDLICRARKRGLKVYGATITPNEGTTFANVHTPENEAKRQLVNRWIRTTRELDGVADYDLALRDPNRPARLLADYATSDNLHPNDAGHAAIADAIARALR